MMNHEEFKTHLARIDAQMVLATIDNDMGAFLRAVRRLAETLHNLAESLDASGQHTG